MLFPCQGRESATLDVGKLKRQWSVWAHSWRAVVLHHRLLHKRLVQLNAAIKSSQLSMSSEILTNGAAATAILAFFSGGEASSPPIGIGCS